MALGCEVIRLVTYEAQRLADGRWVPGWVPTVHELAWPALVERLTSWRYPPEKAQARSWSPVILGQPHRKCDNVAAVTCLVLDLDSGADLHEAAEPWARWTYLVHTSWSHTPAHPKGRIVLPLAEPVPAEYWARAWRWAQGMVGGLADEQAKDLSRVYYLPSVSGPAAPREAWTHEGELLDLRPWDELPELPAPPPRKPVRIYSHWPSWKQSRAQKEALEHDPDTRLRAADMLGARVSGDRAKGARCPACGRASVWWLVEPRTWTGCACDHRGSCGWAGGLHELLPEGM